VLACNVRLFVVQAFGGFGLWPNRARPLIVSVVDYVAWFAMRCNVDRCDVDVEGASRLDEASRVRRLVGGVLCEGSREASRRVVSCGSSPPSVVLFVMAAACAC